MRKRSRTAPMPGQMNLFYRTATVGTPMPTVTQTSIFDRDPTFAPPSFRFRTWQREARKAMVEIRTGLHAAPDGVGERWAVALDVRYPGLGKDKRIARDFAVDVRTAQSWRAGQAPTCKHLCKAALIHGPSIVVEVLLPGTELERHARIDDGLRELESRLDALRRQINDLKGT